MPALSSTELSTLTHIVALVLLAYLVSIAWSCRSKR